MLKMKQTDWMFKVTRQILTNQRALLQHSLATPFQNMFVTSSPYLVEEFQDFNFYNFQVLGIICS